MLRVRVAALCTDAGRILLARHMHRDRATFLLPGGGIEADESAVDALARELREECGADFAIGDLRYVIETRSPGGTRHLVQVVFEATPRGALGASLDPRVAECAWHSLADLRTLPFYPDVGQQLASDLASGASGYRYILAPWRND